METRLKERLTGAAILIALIVMLVPEMFRGEGDHDATSTATATTSSSGAEGPPLRSYTIDLSNNPKGSVPLQSTGDATAVSSKSESTGVDTAKAEASRAEAPAREELASPAAPKSVAPALSRSAPTTPVSTAAAGGKSAAAGNWSVQLGLFARRENAERLANEVKAKGFNVAITGADPKGLFHVHTAGTSDRASAQALAQRLKGEGFPAAVVAPQ